MNQELYTHINFIKNWNNKLDCEVFSTFRPLSNKYHVGTQYIINERTSKRVPFMATCIMTINFPFNDIPLYLIYLDTGLDRKGFYTLMNRFYGDKLEQMAFTFILLRRNKGL